MDHRFRGQRPKALVTHIDIFPTIAELIGASASELAAHQGRSLLPLLRGVDGWPSDRTALSVSTKFDESKKAENPYYEPGEKIAIQSIRFKYIYRTEGASELYDLVADPYEQNNQIGADLVEGDRLRREAVAMLETRSDRNQSEQLVDEQTLRELEALGYFQ